MIEHIWDQYKALNKLYTTERDRLTQLLEARYQKQYPGCKVAVTHVGENSNVVLIHNNRIIDLSGDWSPELQELVRFVTHTYQSWRRFQPQ